MERKNIRTSLQSWKVEICRYVSSSTYLLVLTDSTYRTGHVEMVLNILHAPVIYLAQFLLNF